MKQHFFPIFLETVASKGEQSVHEIFTCIVGKGVACESKGDKGLGNLMRIARSSGRRNDGSCEGACRDRNIGP